MFPVGRNFQQQIYPQKEDQKPFKGSRKKKKTVKKFRRKWYKRESPISQIVFFTNSLVAFGMKLRDLKKSTNPQVSLVSSISFCLAIRKGFLCLAAPGEATKQNTSKFLGIRTSTPKHFSVSTTSCGQRMFLRLFWFHQILKIEDLSKFSYVCYKLTVSGCN